MESASALNACRVRRPSRDYSDGLLARFYVDYRQGGDAKDRHVRTFWENAGYAKSSFLKVYAGKNGVKVEIHRDDGRGGPYALRKAIVLDE